MNYSRGHLSDNERVVFQTGNHWVVFLRPVFWLIVFGIFGVVIKRFVPEIGNGHQEQLVISIVSWLFLLVPLIYLGIVLIRYFTTEYAVTSRRVIVKEGFLSRSTIEIHLVKIESVRVDQGILDRILGSGTLVTTGTGGTHAPINWMHKPMEFRRHIEEQISRLERSR